MPKPSLKAAVQTGVKPKPSIVTSTRLQTLCEESLQVSAKMSQLKLKKDQIDAQLLKLAKKYDENGNCEVNDEFLMTTVNAANNYCDPALLLKAGVRASIVKKCTRVTTYSYPRVTRKKKLAE